VPAHYSLDPQLGRWVDKQRTIFKNGKMDVERQAKLDELAFDFSVREKTHEENWNLKFLKLKDYNRNHGHSEFLCGLPTILPLS
jgi:hypothetical protein